MVEYAELLKKLLTTRLRVCSVLRLRPSTLAAREINSAGSFSTRQAVNSRNQHSRSQDEMVAKRTRGQSSTAMDSTFDRRQAVADLSVASIIQQADRYLAFRMEADDNCSDQETDSVRDGRDGLTMPMTADSAAL